jgi:hypothetical protein
MMAKAILNELKGRKPVWANFNELINNNQISADLLVALIF